MSLTRIKSENIDSSGDLSIDSDTLYVDVTNNRIGIGTSPSYKLHVAGGAVMVNTGPLWMEAGGSVNLLDPTGNNYWRLRTESGNSFTLSYATSEKLTITNAGNVGIGVSSVQARLQSTGGGYVNSPTLGSLSANAPLYITNPDAGYGLAVGVSAATGHVWLQAQRTDGSATAYNITLNEAGGNVGIGTSSPTGLLHLESTAPSLYFTDSDNSYTSYIIQSGSALYLNFDYYSAGSSTFRIRTGSSTELMRITYDGDIFLGTTTLGVFNGIGVSYDVSLGKYYINSGTNGDYAGLTINQTYDDNNQRKMIDFYHREVYIGDITTTNALVYYNTSSDYRLKENIVDLTGAIARLKQLQPRQFNFIRDPDTTYDGFIAHEVQEVVPNAASGSKDEVNADGTPKYQGIDQSKLVPLLTAALQEAISKIESLESRIATLEGI